MGTSNIQNTWELAIHLQMCPELLQGFYQDFSKKPKANVPRPTRGRPRGRGQDMSKDMVRIALDNQRRKRTCSRPRRRSKTQHSWDKDCVRICIKHFHPLLLQNQLDAWWPRLFPWQRPANSPTAPGLYPKAPPAQPKQPDHLKQLSKWPPPDGQELPQRPKDCQWRHWDVPRDAQWPP